MSVNTYWGVGGDLLSYRYDDFTDPAVTTPLAAVLAHGYTRNSNFWYAWVPALSRDFRVVRPDFRGHGLSRVPISSIGKDLHLLEQLYLDSLALLDEVHATQVVWVGEGGAGNLVGLMIADRVPERLKCLVMTAQSFHGGSPLTKLVIQPDAKPGESVMGPEGDERRLRYGMRAWAELSARSRPWLKEASRPYIEWWIDQVASNDPLISATFHQPFHDPWDWPSYLKRLGVATLCIDGTHDSMLSVEDRAILEANPNVTMLQIEGPGADLAFARPAECAREVLRFVREMS